MKMHPISKNNSYLFGKCVESEFRRKVWQNLYCLLIKIEVYKSVLSGTLPTITGIITG